MGSLARLADVPSMWSQATTKRPVVSWMPCPGPVAYHVQELRFTDSVISRGSLQVAPSSSLELTQTVRFACPWTTCSSPPAAGFMQKRRRTLPLRRSSTAHGFPQVKPGRETTRYEASQVLPESWLLRARMSMSPESLWESCRPSQKANTVPWDVASRAGMR